MKVPVPPTVLPVVKLGERLHKNRFLTVVANVEA
jgi:hypothetical protein